MGGKQNFSISERQLFLRIIDILVVVGSVILTSIFFDFHYFDLLESNFLLWFSVLVFYILFFGQILELYNLRVSSSRYLVVRSIGATSFIVTVFYMFTPIVSPVLPENRMQIVYLFLVLFVPLVIWRFVYIGVVFLPKYHKYLLLIGGSIEIENLIKLIEKKAPDNKVVGYISEESLSDNGESHYFKLNESSIYSIVEKHFISEIVVLDDDLSKSNKIQNQLFHLFENGVPITSEKKFVENITYLVPELELKDSFYDYLALSHNNQSRLYLALIRLIDVITALLGILFLAILLPFLLIGNAIANRGKLFYFQNRVGRKGSHFTIIKLRTMIKNAEENGAVWAAKNDKRVTRFGKFLRQTRLDEIPQFLNILSGDMSLIGPRPERPEFVEELEQQIPFYTIRHIIKPGLTGWAQVMHPYANTIKDYDLKVRYDLYYIKERNLFLDFKIVIKTITTVIFFKGN